MILKKIQYKDFSFIFNEILLYNFYFQYYGYFGRVRLNVNKYYLFEKKKLFNSKHMTYSSEQIGDSAEQIGNSSKQIVTMPL